MKPSTALSTIVALALVATCACAAKNNSRPELISPPPKIGDGDPLQDLQAAAANGDPQASYELGERHLRGDKAPRDVPRALELLEQAARGGSADAAFRLGKLYEDGAVVTKDETKAFSYYRDAAQNGLATAQYNVGAMYASGRGVRRDYIDGLAWLILASRNGADPEGEKQLRAHLEQSDRAHFIKAAEERAQDLAAGFEKTGPAAPEKTEHKG